MKKKKTPAKNKATSGNAPLAPLDSRNWISESTTRFAAAPPANSGSGGNETRLHIEFTNPSPPSKIILCGETILGNVFATGPDALTADITVTGPNGTVCGQGIEQCAFIYSLNESECDEDLTFTAAAQNCGEAKGVIIPAIVEEVFTNPIQVNEGFEFDHQNPGQAKRHLFGKTLFELQYKGGKEPCVINVTIKVNFISGAFPENIFSGIPGYRRPTDAELTASIGAFQQGITATWSNQFQLCCKKIHAITKIITPHEIQFPRREVVDTCCPIRFIIQNDQSGEKIGVFLLPGRYSVQTSWNLTDPGFSKGQTAAHEVGHFFGNAEEYGVTTDIKGPIIPYGQAIQDPNSVMGDKVGKVSERHFWRILKAVISKNTVFEGPSLKRIGI